MSHQIWAGPAKLIPDWLVEFHTLDFVAALAAPEGVLVPVARRRRPDAPPLHSSALEDEHVLRVRVRRHGDLSPWIRDVHVNVRRQAQEAVARGAEAGEIGEGQARAVEEDRAFC